MGFLENASFHISYCTAFINVMETRKLTRGDGFSNTSFGASTVTNQIKPNTTRIPSLPTMNQDSWNRFEHTNLRVSQCLSLSKANGKSKLGSSGILRGNEGHSICCCSISDTLTAIWGFSIGPFIIPVNKLPMDLNG